MPETESRERCRRNDAGQSSCGAHLAGHDDEEAAQKERRSRSSPSSPSRSRWRKTVRRCESLGSRWIPIEIVVPRRSSLKSKWPPGWPHSDVDHQEDRYDPAAEEMRIQQRDDAVGPSLPIEVGAANGIGLSGEETPSPRYRPRYGRPRPARGRNPSLLSTAVPTSLSMVDPGSSRASTPRSSAECPSFVRAGKLLSLHRRPDRPSRAGW